MVPQAPGSSPVGDMVANLQKEVALTRDRPAGAGGAPRRRKHRRSGENYRSPGAALCPDPGKGKGGGDALWPRGSRVGDPATWRMLGSPGRDKT